MSPPPRLASGPREHARAHHQHQSGEQDGLAERRADRHPVPRNDVVPACWVSVAEAITGRSTSATTVNRSSKMSQPIATLPGSESVAPRCRSARNRTTVLATEIASPRTSDERTFQPKHHPRLFPVPWRSRSVQPHPAGYAIHADQILDTEMQSHAEHEQGNPDLRQLLSLMGICDQPGRERPHGDAREQVSDDGGQSYQPGEVASDERRAQCDGDGGDEIGAVDLIGSSRSLSERAVTESESDWGSAIHATWDVMTKTPRALLPHGASVRSRRRTSCWRAASSSAN